jgi:hypothetical protein
MALPNPLQAFVWGAGGAQLTPEQIARQREIADALLAKAGDTSPVASWTQGAARIADAISGKIKESRLDKAEAANTTTNSGIAEALLKGGTSGFPAAPAQAGTFPATPSAGGRTASIPQTASAQAIRDGLIKRGLSEHAADGFLMNYQDESGLNPGINEKNPIVAGSRGGFGLAQWTGPRRRALEEFAAQQGKPASDMDTQLDFTMHELGGPEAAAYQAIQAAPDAGSAAAAIVNQFLRPRDDLRAKREASYLKGGAPVQVASNDPASGLGVPFDSSQPYDAEADARAKDISQVIGDAPVSMVQPAGDGQPPVAGDPATATPAGQRVMSALMSQQPIGGAPMSMLGAPQAAPEQAAQAAPLDLSQLPVMAGGTADAIPAGQAQRGINPAIIEALSNPAASEQTRKIAGMLLGQQMQSQDPAAQLDMKYKQAQIDALSAKAVPQIPDSVQALDLRAQRAGLKPGTPAYNDFMVSGGSKGTSINVDTGTVPQGYQVVRDDQGRVLRYEPIPGGPADTAKSDAAATENRATSSDVITGAADKIRDLSKNPLATGMTGALASNLANTDAAEVYRQVDVLKSNATIESLNAMRAASKTGGALGNVTEGEGKMLAAKSGALDPKSPHFQSQLDDYERTLLRTIHGKDAGDKIFDEMQKKAPSGSPQAGIVEDGYRFKGGDPSDQSNWEPVQ